MSALDEIRKRLQSTANAQGGNGNSSPNAFYPFWNAPNDTTTTLRFLPDGDTNNVFFWRERQIIRIPFKNVEGHPELSDVFVEVPCMKMYGKDETCPIQTETRPWWKTEKEDLARTYWPKKTYIFQGFVRAAQFDEDGGVPENPIRRFVINKTIHKLIEASLMDPDMENTPVSYDNGTDFRIVKTQKGQYADYSTSTFSRKESSLTVEERAAIDTHGLFDLGTFLPKKPDAAEQQIIYDMFVESLNPDSTYRAEWANAFRPKNVQISVGQGQASTTQPVSSQAPRASAPVAQPAAAPAQAAPTAAPAPVEPPKASQADDVLASLRARINSNK